MRRVVPRSLALLALPLLGGCLGYGTRPLAGPTDRQGVQYQRLERCWEWAPANAHVGALLGVRPGEHAVPGVRTSTWVAYGFPGLERDRRLKYRYDRDTDTFSLRGGVVLRGDPDLPPTPEGAAPTAGDGTEWLRAWLGRDLRGVPAIEPPTN